jgi:hypothetical protein
VRYAINSLLAWISRFTKCGPDAVSDGLSKKCRNKFLQWAGMPQSIQIHLLWRSHNGPTTVFLALTMFLTISDHHSNGQDASKGHIASSWQCPILHGSSIPARFKFFKPASCEVFTGTSCSFSKLDFFLLRFLAFFPVI